MEFRPIRIADSFDQLLPRVAMAFRAALDKMTVAATTATTGSVYFSNMFSCYRQTAEPSVGRGPLSARS
jgi:hypothetical protein